MPHASPQAGQGVGRAPQAPAIPAPPQPPPRLATNQKEFQALVAKRVELETQIETVTDRRQELEQQLEDASGATRTGLEARIRLLDARATQLEQQVLENDELIAQSIAGGVATGQSGTTVSSEPKLFTREDMGAAMVGEALALVLFFVWLYRRGIRRAKAGFSRGATVDPQRMEQLQNSIDAIAVEVERISEGQRFVSKMLNEGSAQPVSIGMREAEEALAKRRPP
ncbi:MAG TPA: hypothetical protein VFU01_17730 [Gemmatimonadaceae bacterium]|nr:hypothetical protein [Gemmatimonadaceae bacterium]